MLPKPFTYLDLHSHSPNKDPNVFTIQNQILGVDPPMPHWYSAGIHPWYTDSAVSSELFKDMTSNPNCLLVGECGLDKIKGDPLPVQTVYFEKQIEWAERIKKPVIIHCVRAHQEVLKIHKSTQPTVPWIIHGFNKNTQVASQFLEQGFYLSFGKAIITQPSTQNTFKQIPIERIFLETDDQTEYTIQNIYETASNLLNIDLENLQQQIKQNFKTLFQQCKM